MRARKDLEKSPIPHFLCWSRIIFASTGSTRGLSNFFFNASPDESPQPIQVPVVILQWPVLLVSVFKEHVFMLLLCAYLHFLSLDEFEIMFFSIVKIVF